MTPDRFNQILNRPVAELSTLSHAEIQAAMDICRHNVTAPFLTLRYEDALRILADCLQDQVNIRFRAIAEQSKAVAETGKVTFVPASPVTDVPESSAPWLYENGKLKSETGRISQ